MAENLAYLPYVSSSNEDSKTVPKYYVYNYGGVVVATAKSTPNYSTYGVLYNFQSALTACPTGWHLPTNAEWITLNTFVDAGGTIAGAKLKSRSGWISGVAGMDDYGFSALPAGRFGFASFRDSGEDANFLSANIAETTSYVWIWTLNNTTSSFNSQYGQQDYGYSVRCLQDPN
jgi:uncharacterized protein (TIGR02145 family)